MKVTFRYCHRWFEMDVYSKFESENMLKYWKQFIMMKSHGKSIDAREKYLLKKKKGTMASDVTVALLKVCSNPSPWGFSVLSLHILHASAWLLFGSPVFPPLDTWSRCICRHWQKDLDVVDYIMNQINSALFASCLTITKPIYMPIIPTAENNDN